MATVADPPVVGETEVVLAVDELAKAFGQTQALRACSFQAHAGEVHAVVGENGSGKSTLVKILGGVHRPDSGTLTVDGSAIRGRHSPRAMIEAGVVPVFQEVLVVGVQSVLDNVWIGADGLFRRAVPDAVKRERAERVLADLLGDEAPALDDPVESLPLSVRQVCVIARALVRDPRILILDESTSALDVLTRDRLFSLVRGRTADRGTVIFISHRMDEIEEIADRITVLRSGRSVATVQRGQASARDLVRLMSGADKLTETDRESAPPTATGATVLRADRVRLRPAAPAIEFSLAAGEIVGLAGLEGHGQDAFLRALATGAADGEIVRCLDRGPAVIASAAHAAELGVAYVPRDRRSESLFSTLSIRDNFAAATLAEDRRGGVLLRSRTDRRLAAYREQLAITLGALGLPITTLSGGNQQKIVMARWLAADPAVLVLNDPTRGVDLGAKRDLYALLRELASRQVAVVMLSTEVDELIELMDRVLVFREGHVSAALGREQLSRARLVASFFGREGDDDD